MSSTGITVTDALAQKMAYLNQSQAVHMQNIAGANVPGFQARELAPFTFSHALTQASALKVTDPRHIVPASMAGANAATVKVSLDDFQKMAVHTFNQQNGFVIGVVHDVTSETLGTMEQFDAKTYNIRHKRLPLKIR